MMQDLFTPNKNRAYMQEKRKRFMRKPNSQKSQSSISRKSSNSIDMRQMYIKSPSSIQKQGSQSKKNFFESLATQVIQTTAKKAANTNNPKIIDNIYSNELYRTKSKTMQSKFNLMESEIQLKDHQLGVLAGECHRIKLQFNQQKDKRHKIQQQRKNLSKQLKDTVKNMDATKIQLKKVLKEKQYLIKQVEFLQKINYDEKASDLQSYRQKLLAHQIDNLKNQLKKSHSIRQKQLQTILNKVSQQKYTLQSHYKAMKIANQCLIKQLNQNNDDIHEIILNSEQYVKLREKYIKFLDEYKQLRNQYWTMKSQVMAMNKSNQGESLFNITASEGDTSGNNKSNVDGSMCSY